MRQTTTPKQPQQPRPTSIDIEDEFHAKIKYGRLEDNNKKIEVSPSRIPIAKRTPSGSSGDEDNNKRPSRGSSPPKDFRANKSEDEERLLPDVKSKIPLPNNVPAIGWSLSKERKYSSGNSSSVVSPTHSSSSSSASSSSSSSNSSTTSSNTSTSKSSRTDSATEELLNNEEDDNDKKVVQSRRGRKKQYEAFMMTGDRMIQLAKTPAAANHDFKSHYRDDEPPKLDLDIVNSEPTSPDVVHMRTGQRSSVVRSSKSEDQLLINEHDDHVDEEEAISGSVHTLLKKDSPDEEFSTSSLISSEHYNGESLLQDNLSPEGTSSCSPDTPEWSLLDSFHKKNNEEDKRNGDFLEDEKTPENEEEKNITNHGNRVVITIGSSVHSDLSKTPTSPNGDSSGTLTPSEDNNRIFVPKSPPPPPIINQQQPMNSLDSSEGESDMESLHSYHPPVRQVDVPSAVRLAKRLFHLDGFKRTDVSRHLGKNNEFSQVVADEYVRYFDFSGGQGLDVALRRFLSNFCLTGETQERERVLLHFSRRYLECNPSFVQELPRQLYRSLDAVHTLTCAIMLLNTDLHGDQVTSQRKMTCNEFIENLSELNDGQDFPRDLLKSVYYAVKHEPIPWTTTSSGDNNVNVGDLEDVNHLVAAVAKQPLLKEEQNKNGNTNTSTNTTDVTIGKGGVNPFLNLPDPSTSVDYKKGYVMRKCCMDSNGKKTKLGKRSWKMFFVCLRDMVLYCFKDEKSVNSNDLGAAVRIHHGLAVRASDYHKKQFVFRLYTADQAQYLFQTSDEKELLTWIDAINYVVATFSAPQLPAPCSSSAARFQRPLMPSSKSGLNPQQQLNEHEKQLMLLKRDIEQHLQNPPPRNAKGAVIQNYKDKQEFLGFEIMRYDTYSLTLRTKNSETPNSGGDSPNRRK